MNNETMQTCDNVIGSIVASIVAEDIVAEPIVDDTILEDRNNSSLLNTTTTTKASKRIYNNVEKTCSIKDDISAGKFTETRTFAKRTALQKRLPFEVFDSPANPVFR